MNRREFITLVGGACAAWPLSAGAQQASPMPRVGVLLAEADDRSMQARLEGLRQGLERLGWSDGRNIQMVNRFAEGKPERFQSLAKELVAMQPDLIIAQTPLVVAAVRQETSVIPIVFVDVSDPIGAGFIASLARPGGNLTGLVTFEAGIVGKWLAMLKEIDPALAGVALVGNPKTTAFAYFLSAATAAAPSLGVELIPQQVVTASDIERVVELSAGMPRSGLVFPPDTTTVLHRDLVIALAAKHHIPAVYAFRFFVTAGVSTASLDALARRRTISSGVPLGNDSEPQLPQSRPESPSSCAASCAVGRFSRPGARSSPSVAIAFTALP